jgi:predicted HicB family RNase H-like nuclease
MSKTKFTTTIDGELVKEIKIRAIQEGKSVANILEELIKEYLSKPVSQQSD